MLLGLYGGINARKVKVECRQKFGVKKGITASGGVWRHQCSKMYDGSNALQK